MRSNELGRRLLLAVSLAATAPAWTAGCKQEHETTAAAASYTVRGQIETLPAAAGQSIFLHHEAIPTFVTHDGKQAGMMSMTMGFAVAPGVSLDGLAKGDKVEFTFAVDWETSPTTQITAIRKLPPETTLDLTGM
jgi:Cu/Ag efflux protein CusF